MNDIKRILYISYFYPPMTEIAAERAWHMSHYFAQEGIITDVISGYKKDNLSNHSKLENNINQYEIENYDFFEKTSALLSIIRNSNDAAKINDINVIDSYKRRSLNRLYNYKVFIRDNIFPCHHSVLPDRYLIWNFRARKVIRRLLKTNTYDYIISSSGPPNCHILGNWISKHYHVPWLADYRDLWTGNYGTVQARLWNIINREVEKRTIKRAKILTTVSKGLALELETLHDKNTYVIYNGYPEIRHNYKKTDPAADSIKFTYTGDLYGGKRSPDLFFKAVANILNEHLELRSKIKIHYAGREFGIFLECAKKMRIDNLLINHGIISRDASLNLQSSSNMLLILGINSPVDKGWLTAKLFEYIGVKKPILFCGWPEGEINDILKETNSGLAANEVEQIGKYLIKIINKSHDLSFCNIDKYSRKNQALRMLQILRACNNAPKTQQV